MEFRRDLAGPLSILVFAVGLLVGLALFAVLVWSGVETLLFDPVWRYDAPLRSLRCPVMITPSEAGVVSAGISNPLDRPTERFLRVHVTSGSILRVIEFTEAVELEPGETKRVAWEVTRDHAVYDRVIMVNAILRGRYGLPTRQSSCGIIVVDVPFFTGHQVFGLSLAVSLLAMAGGYTLWVRSDGLLTRRRRRAARAMIALGASVGVGIVLALMGWWLPGLILFVVVLVAIGVTIGYFLERV